MGTGPSRMGAGRSRTGAGQSRTGAGQSPAAGDGTATDLFKAQKEKVLDLYIIGFHNVPEFYPSAPCVHDFVLEKPLGSVHGPNTYILARCPVTAGNGVPRITAAWLPYFEEKAAEIDLADAAYDSVEYFFTAELTGCRLEIGRADRPKVLHIAADLHGLYKNTLIEHMEPSAKEELTALMDQEAQKAFGDRPHRKYSKSTGYPKTPWVTFVGFRRNTFWDFYAQERSGNVEKTVRQIVTRRPLPEKS